MTPAVTVVGVAVVERDGRFLVGVRKGTVLAGAAEFPGGKAEPSETPAACAVRECLEETSLAVEPVRALDVRPWDYPHGRIEIHFWLCRPLDPSAEPRSPFRWANRDELVDLPFPPANVAVVGLLCGGV